MIDVVCDVGARFSKIAATRRENSKEIFVSIVATRECQNFNSVINKLVAKTKPTFFERKTIHSIGSKTVPGMPKTEQISLGNALAYSISEYWPQGAIILDCGHMQNRIVEINSEGHLINEITNERCTGGGGRFIETMAAALQINLNNTDSVLTASTSPYLVSSGCMVFAESEVITQVNQGGNVSDILMGVINSVAEKANGLLGRIKKSNRPLILLGKLTRIQGFSAIVGKTFEKGAIPIELGGDPNLVHIIAALRQLNKTKITPIITVVDKPNEWI